MTRPGRAVAAVAVGSLALLALAVVCLKLQVSLAAAALLFLIVVVFTALVGGFLAAGSLSLLAVLTLEYAFVEPRFSFHLAGALDAVELVVFLTTAFIISRLVTRARERELEARLIMDAMPASVIVGSTPRSLDSYSNQRFLDYSAQSLEQLRSGGAESILHPDDREAYRVASLAAEKDGRAFEKELRLRNARGEYRWFLRRVVPMRDEEGRITQWCATSIDIDDRKRAEELIREQAGLLNLTHDTIFVRDLNDVITYWNRGAEELYGWKPEEAIGKVSHELMKTVFPAPLDVINEQLFSTGRWEGDLVHTKRDGKPIIVASRWALQRNAEGNPVAILETNNDITARRWAEEVIREKAGLLDLAHDAILVRDPAAIITYWNRGAEELYGWKAEEVIGKVSHEILHTVFPAPLENITTELLASGRWEGELTHAKRDGIRVTVASRWSVQRDAAGEVIGFLETNIDITARKRAEEEIRQLQDQLYRENIALREEVDRTSMFEEIVGSSEPIRKVLNHISKVAGTDSTVLITGETGTGKELVARAIHKRSLRSGRAFVSVNCAAVPQSLISSELFGHEKGAFTGATQRRLGRFELANGGTLFLDEVGELPAETQVALLRVLQEREFERVGGTQRVSVDVRVLTATNRDLKEAVDHGTFRRDLYYRLNVFPVHIPPLRERTEDIALLVEYFIQRYGSKTGKKIRKIEKKTLEMFQDYEWPGNIRELQNVVERAVILCDDDTLAVDDNWLQGEVRKGSDEDLALPSALDEREREMIEAALKASRGRVSGPSGAAARLGIPRSTLESKIRTLRIDKHQYRRSSL